MRAAGVVSRTVTVKVTDELLPFGSEAVQVTGVVPIANRAPEAGEQLTDVTPNASVAADAGNVTSAPSRPDASASTLAGRWICGGVVSCTVTIASALDDAPCESFTVRVRVCLANGRDTFTRALPP